MEQLNSIPPWQSRAPRKLFSGTPQLFWRRGAHDLGNDKGSSSPGGPATTFLTPHCGGCHLRQWPAAIVSGTTHGRRGSFFAASPRSLPPCPASKGTSLCPLSHQVHIFPFLFLNRRGFTFTPPWEILILHHLCCAVCSIFRFFGLLNGLLC